MKIIIDIPDYAPQRQEYYPTYIPSTTPWINITDGPSNQQPCMWDSMPETFPGSGIKIGGLSCPCPKCSPYC